MGKSLNKQLVTELARDMIKDTEIAANYAKHIGKPMTSTITPGDSWYKNFMKRNSDKIKTSKENIMDVNRKTYCTKENFANMYDRVYHHMTEAGVAIKLDEEIMLDKDGKQVYSKDLMYGLPTRYKMVNPGNFLMMDETGCNTNQKKDGKVGGERYIVPTDGSGVGAIGSTTDVHFSCACFTSGLGTPVMCAIIFSSEQDVKRIPISWKAGIDRTVHLSNGVQLDFDAFLADSSKSGGALGGGPACVHNGKLIPCFYGVSPHGGITGKMLADMLGYLDEKQVFERSNNTLPFLLVDGHNSRLSYEFLKYITGNDHKWKVCIGVPYGTHLWQVADSPEMNGAFKIGLTKAKREYLANNKGTRETFSPTDICPLVRTAWNASFANVVHGRKAVAERGWGPLNYVLLNHPQLISASSQDDDGIFPLETTNTSDETPISTALRENRYFINLEGPAIDKFFNVIIHQYAKDEGRIRAYEQRKAAAAENESAYEKLKRIGKLSSGTLTANNIFGLDENTFQMAAERREQDLSNQLAKNQFDLSHKIFCHDSTKLKSKDYRVLLTFAKKDGESPIKKTLDLMKQQFLRRNMPSRLLDMQCIPAVSTEAGGNNATDTPVSTEDTNNCSTYNIFHGELDKPTDIELDGMIDGTHSYSDEYMM